MYIDITIPRATDEWEKLMVCDIPLENEFFTLSGKRVSETFNFTKVKKMQSRYGYCTLARETSGIVYTFRL